MKINLLLGNALLSIPEVGSKKQQEKKEEKYVIKERITYSHESILKILSIINLHDSEKEKFKYYFYGQLLTLEILGLVLR